MRHLKSSSKLLDESLNKACKDLYLSPDLQQGTIKEVQRLFFWICLLIASAA